MKASKVMRNGKLRSYMSMSQDERMRLLEVLLEVQDGLCCICERPLSVNSGPAGAHIDHDHDTGVIRGALCASCNKGLGFFYDSPELLMRAVEYLELSGVDISDAVNEEEDDPKDVDTVEDVVDFMQRSNFLPYEEED